MIIGKRFFILLAMISCSAQLSFAAAPLMHLCLASKFLALHGTKYTPDQKNSFLRGTSFPDIRYLGCIAREKTHDKDVTLQTISTTVSPFEAGKKFHVWVDEVREQLIEQWRIYEILSELSKSPHHNRGLFLKLIEDAVLFNNTSNKALDALMLFSTIDPEAHEYGISSKKIVQWHAILTTYLSIQPSWLLKLNSLLLSKVPKLWSTDVPRLAEEKILIDYVDRLLTEFEKRIADFKP